MTTIPQDQSKRKVAVHAAAFQVAASLTEARAGLATAAGELAKANYSLAYFRAMHETAAFETAGEKALGSNEAARARALTIALAEDPNYQAERDYHTECELDLRMAEVDVQAQKDQLNILLACLDAGITDIEESLLWLGLPTATQSHIATLAELSDPAEYLA